MVEKIQKDMRDVSENKWAAALSYIWIIFLYGLLFKKGSPFTQFHAKQGAALFVLEIIAPLFGPFAFVVIVIAVLLAIKGVKASLEGKYWVLPLIGEWIRRKKI